MAPSVVRRFVLFLLPGFFQAALSLALLPLSTQILGPADFGAFALLSAITGFLAIFATLGAGYLLATSFGKLDSAQLSRLISTLALASLSIGILLSAVLLLSWSALARVFVELRAIPESCVVLAATTMVLSLPWTVAVELVRLDREAKWYAYVVTAQALMSALALLVVLFYLRLGVIALFASAAAGAATMFVGAVMKLKPHLVLKFDLAHLTEIFRIAKATIVAGFSEAAYLLVERNMLTGQSGLAQLGIYSHSQQYRSVVSMPVNAVANSMWPVALEDARAEDGTFARTQAAWSFAQFGLTLIGIAFATMGSHVISMLTHGKFTEAYALATLWVIYVMVQNAGKPQTAILYAHGQGARYARVQAITMLAGMFLILGLVPMFGAYGAFSAALAQQVAMRVAIHFSARKFGISPFQDHPAILGVCLVLLVLGLRSAFSTGLAWDLILLFGALVLLLAPGYLLCSRYLPMLQRSLRIVPARGP